jgi:hypothetical protein
MSSSTGFITGDYLPPYVRTVVDPVGGGPALPALCSGEPQTCACIRCQVARKVREGARPLDRPWAFCTGLPDSCGCASCTERQRLLREVTGAPAMQLVEQTLDLVCGTCRRDYGQVRVRGIVAPGTVIEAEPVCAGCRAEGRLGAAP